MPKRVIPIHHSGNWAVRDSGGRQLPIVPRFERGWELTALGGGYPLGLFGEWDSGYLLPLSVWASREFVVL